MQSENKTQQQQKAVTKGSRKLVVITGALLSVAVIICVLVVSQVLSKGYVSVGGYSLFQVATGSMEPEYSVGTLLVVKKTPIEEIQIGDIVNFRSRDAGMLDQMITHRVIGIHKGVDGSVYLETKGDANPQRDANYVSQDNLIGKVIKNTGSGSFLAGLVGLLTSPTGFFACIVIPCMAIGVLTMRDCIGNIRKEIDSISQTLETMEENQPLSAQLGEEEYEALCERLRKELLEELKKDAPGEGTTE
jgi:signal peptidase